MTRDHRIAAWAFFAGPSAWVVNLVAGYALVQRVHATGSKWPILGVAIGSAAVSAIGSALAISVLRKTRDEKGWHFVAISSVALGAFFMLVIAATGLAQILQGAGD